MNWRKAFLVMKNVAESQWSYALNTGTVVCGSDPACPIWVPNIFGGVAARHAETGLDQRGRWLKDLGSIAGTAINGVWIDGRQASLKIGDCVWIGGVEIAVVERVSELARINHANWPPGHATEPDKWGNPIRDSFRLLSDCELEVTIEFSRGNIRPEQLATEIGIEPSTGKTHLRSIYTKLGIHRVAELQALLSTSTSQSRFWGGGCINDLLGESFRSRTANAGQFLLCA